MNEFTNQMQDQMHNLLDYVPGMVKVIVVLLVGWLIARLVKKVVVRLLNKTKVDEKLLNGSTKKNTNKLIGNVAYYIIMIMVLLTALEMMGVKEGLDPVKGMLSEMLSFIPNLFAAGILGFIGYILAKFLSNLVSIGGNILDKWIEKLGFKDTDKIVAILQQVVFILVFLPFIIFALNALELDAISEPANEVLSTILNIIPNILAAAAVITLFIVGGTFLAKLVQNLLESLNVNKLSETLQLNQVLGNQSLSKILSKVLFFFIAFFGIITGVELLGFDQLTDILYNLLEITGQIAFGVIILILGNFISKLVSGAVAKGGSAIMATITRIATMGLFVAMALRSMNIAPDIVNLAFALTLGCVAVVIALAYGLGGREAAGEHFKEIIQKFKNKESK